MNTLPQWMQETNLQHRLLAEQRESNENRLLVNFGHPLARQYQRARNHFDQLQYAASLYHRFYSVRDSDNFSLVSPPRLIIVRENDHRSLEIQARQEAAAGWPHAALYKLNCGDWQIKTADRKLIEEFRRFTACCTTEMAGGSCLLSFAATDPDTFEWIAGMLDTHQREFYETLRNPAGTGSAAEHLLRRLGSEATGLPDAWL